MQEHAGLWLDGDCVSLEGVLRDSFIRNTVIAVTGPLRITHCTFVGDPTTTLHLHNDEGHRVEIDHCLFDTESESVVRFIEPKLGQD